jgi:putative ABC transport system permease protein
MIVVLFSETTALPILMTPGLAAGLFLITVAMCAVSAVSAIMKVTRMDPAMVFGK